MKGEGDEFKGLLFTKLSSMLVRDHVVETMRKEFQTHDTWVKPDKPIQERAITGFLLGLKRLLVQWGFSK